MGLADTWLQPFTMGWHLKRADITVADALWIPTGRYTPGASTNIGYGYFGNHFTTGSTFYLTKNKGTSANLFTDWEVHSNKNGTNVTPGQAFSDEWGVGQVLPLKKNFSQLLQLGGVGYDQWQVTANSGLDKNAPFYSVHAAGAAGQLHPSAQELQRVLQVLLAVQGLFDQLGQYAHVRIRVDSAGPETHAAEAIGGLHLEKCASA